MSETSEIRSEHYGGDENPFEPRRIINWYSLNFNLGNVIKYVLRFAYCLCIGKVANVDDLRKAATYLKWEIERHENN